MNLRTVRTFSKAGIETRFRRFPWE